MRVVLLRNFSDIADFLKSIHPWGLIIALLIFIVV